MCDDAIGEEKWLLFLVYGFSFVSLTVVDVYGMGAIKYKYALNGQAEKVVIDAVTPEIRKVTKFKCISCGNELVACLKEGKKQRHFRHKVKVECNPETYLHEMGKYTFIKSYKDCLAIGKPYNIIIRQKVSCLNEDNCPVKRSLDEYTDLCHSDGLQTFDLTRYYDILTEEKKIDSFKADVLLESSKGHQPILIEIKVSHPCEENKIQSGYRIIEIGLNMEEDLELIESCQLRQSAGIETDGNRMNEDKSEEPSIRFYNFQEVKKELLNYYKIHQFGIYRNSPSHFCLDEVVPCGERCELIKCHKNENNFLYEILFFNESSEFRRLVFGVARAREKRLQIRNCFLCRYHHVAETCESVYCDMYSKQLTNPRCDSTQAVDCHGFTPDKRAYERYLNLSVGFEEMFY